MALPSSRAGRASRAPGSRLLRRALASIILLVACQDAGTGTDGAPATLSITPAVGATQGATQVLVAAFWVAGGGAPRNDLAHDLSTAGGGVLAARVVDAGAAPAPVALTFDLSDCLAEASRAVSGEGCQVRFVVALLRGGLTLPSEHPTAVRVSTTDVIDARYAGPFPMRAGERTSVPDPVTVSVVRTVRIAPASPSVVIGTTVALSAEALDAAGVVLTGAAMTPRWSSANAAVASVDAAGVLTGLSAGATTVRAEIGGVVASVPVTVQACALRGVRVTPASVDLVVGGSAALEATVDADACLTDRAVRWTTSDAAVATVDASGRVTAVAAGAATIRATLAADATMSGSAQVVVTKVPQPSVAIASVTRFGVPIDLNAIAGACVVGLDVRLVGRSGGELRLVLVRPSGVVEDIGSLALGDATDRSVSLDLSTDVAQAGGTARFANGAYTLRAELRFDGATVSQSSMPVTLANRDYATVGVSGERTSTDATGQIWHAGPVTVTVSPVSFTGTIAGGSVSVTGTRGDGSAFSFSSEYTGSGMQRITVAGLTGTTIAQLRTNVTVTRSTLGPVEDVRYAAPFIRVDNEPPTPGQFALSGPSAQSGWVGLSYAFATGYTLGTMPTGGNDRGVGRSTASFQAAPINSNVQRCASTQIDLAFRSTVSGADLAETPVNGSVPFGPAYCLRFVETDALGNAITTYPGTIFGVDRAAPVIVGEVPGSVANFATFTNAAAAAAAVYGFEVNDTLSGVNGTPINYSVTRLAPGVMGAAACVVGAMPGCTGVDGAQTVLVNLANRRAFVSVTGGSVAPGYYTMSGIVRDRAGNATAPLASRKVLVDGTAPSVSRVGISTVGVMLGNTTVTFNADATDDIELKSLTASLVYPAGELGCGTTSIGIPFDATLTQSVSNWLLSCGGFNRTLTTSPGTAGAKPTATRMWVTDVAGNVSAPASRPIDAVDVASSSFTFASVGVSSFTVGASATSVCNPTSASPCSSTPSFVRVDASLSGGATIDNPIGAVLLYYRVPGGVWVPYATIGAPSQLDAPGSRTYRYSAIFDPPADFAPGTTVQVTTVGWTMAGDAIMASPVTLSVVNP